MGATLPRDRSNRTRRSTRRVDWVQIALRISDRAGLVAALDRLCLHRDQVPQHDGDGDRRGARLSAGPAAGLGPCRLHRRRRGALHLRLLLRPAPAPRGSRLSHVLPVRLRLGARTLGWRPPLDGHGDRPLGRRDRGAQGAHVRRRRTRARSRGALARRPAQPSPANGLESLGLRRSDHPRHRRTDRPERLARPPLAGVVDGDVELPRAALASLVRGRLRIDDRARGPYR